VGKFSQERIYGHGKKGTPGEGFATSQTRRCHPDTPELISGRVISERGIRVGFEWALIGFQTDSHTHHFGAALVPNQHISKFGVCPVMPV